MKNERLIGRLFAKRLYDLAVTELQDPKVQEEYLAWKKAKDAKGGVLCAQQL